MAVQRGNLQSIIPAALTGRNGRRMTAEQIKREREIANALLAPSQRPVTNWADGAAGLVDAFNGARKNRALEAAETQNADTNQRIMQGLFGSFGGASPTSAMAPMAQGATAPTAGVASASIPGGDRAGYIRNGLIARGIPEHIADASLVNFKDESGLDPAINEANPIVPGSRGGFGLYQLTGPRRNAYEGFAASRGVDPGDIDTQLDFYAAELGLPGTGLEAQPFFGSEARAARSIFAAPDTASAAQAIVTNFLRPAPEHRASRVARYAGLGGGMQATQRPVEVASLDPSAGVAEATGRTAYTGPPLYDDNPMTGIAPTGLPGSTAADNATIERFHAGNGSTAMGYGERPPPSGSRDSFGDMRSQAVDPVAAALMGGAQGASTAPVRVAQNAPQYRQQPYQAPNYQPPAPSAINPAIIEALTSPYADEQTRQIGQLLFQQDSQTRAAQAKAAADRAALIEQRGYDEYVRNDDRAYDRSTLQEQRGYDRYVLGDQRAYDGVIRQDDQRREDERYRVTDRIERERIDLQRQGLVPTDVREFEYGRDNPAFFEHQERLRRAGAASTNVTVGESDKFYENLDRKNAERFATLSDGGQAARGRQAQVNQLDALLRQSPSGSEAAIKTWLGDYGVATDGLDTLQAATALIEKLVPEQREPGSGPMSDADIAGFRRSLPRTINQPGGNELIIGRLRAINEYDISRGEIADMVADRAITPAEGRKRLRELANPLEGFTEAVNKLGEQKVSDTTPRDASGVPTGGQKPATAGQGNGNVGLRRYNPQTRRFE